MARNKCDMRPYWKAFKARKRAPRVSPEAITAHMQCLLGSAPQRAAEGPDTESARAAQLTASPAADGADLDQPFTAAEVVGGIKAMRVKACTVGLLTVEALTLVGPLLAPCLAALFNLCAAAGRLPTSWALSGVTPIHKGGDELDPSNYRGIAVGTAIGKLYATMLNQRMTAWLEAHQLRARGQGGYRLDHRTQDHLYLLRTLVEDHRQRKQPLFVCFVDLAKFFDSVDRQLLWRKLQAVGVGGRMLSAVQAIYATVPVAVKIGGSLSETFESVMGVKQGCPLSPTLAGIFLDDFERSVAEAVGTDLPVLQGQPVPPILWADDLLLASTTARGLQRLLDVLSAFSDRWRLTVNSSKTKAIEFRRPHDQVLVLALNLQRATHFRASKLVRVFGACAFIVVKLLSTHAYLALNQRSALCWPSEAAALRSSCTTQSCCANSLTHWFLPVMMYGVEVWGAQLGASVMEQGRRRLN